MIPVVEVFYFKQKSAYNDIGEMKRLIISITIVMIPMRSSLLGMPRHGLE